MVTREATRRRSLEIAALGVVFGDIGTSPLYAFDLALNAAAKLPLEIAVLGVLSLIVWTVTVIVTIKYVMFVIEADNHGEGGIFALVTRMQLQKSDRPADRILLAAGLCSAALIFGDGMLTPSISVLSAIEGLEIVAPSLQRFVVPASIAILVSFFVFQRRGTDAIADLFGPIMLAWFLVIGVLGLLAIVRYPAVLSALSPAHAVALFLEHPVASIAISGAAFLAVTGAEALYADLGQFGRGPIRRAWLTIAMPALGLCYFGQGAHALALGNIPQNPMFELAPSWFGLPLLLLATAATIIASQAILTGAFTLAKQAMELGLLPPLRVVYTSEENERHVYIPAVNGLLMIGTILITVGFASSAALGGAYGIAVAGAMATTTLLLIADQVRHPSRAPLQFTAAAVVFIIVDGFFFATNLLKIRDGGWLPLLVASSVILVMASWRYGRSTVTAQQFAEAETLGKALEHFADKPDKVDAKILVFLTRLPVAAPLAMTRLARSIDLFRGPIVIAYVSIASKPRLSPVEHVALTNVDRAVWRADIRFGYMEETNVPEVLEPVLASALSVSKPIVYVAGAERIVQERLRLTPRSVLLAIFALLARNTVRAPDRYRLPGETTLEIGHTTRL